MPEIETARLRLRLFRREDVDALAAIFSKPAVMRFLPGGQPIPRERIPAGIERRISDWETRGFGLFALEDKATGALIGQAGLFPLEDTDDVEVAYLLDEPYWGQGLATEAARACLRFGFETLHLPRIVAVAVPANRASTRVMEKLGMEYQGPDHHYGLDVARYAITRHAYEVLSAEC
jgi:ribosomal-protein-alanine N-acetyltransferase